MEVNVSRFIIPKLFVFFSYGIFLYHFFSQVIKKNEPQSFPLPLNTHYHLFQILLLSHLKASPLANVMWREVHCRSVGVPLHFNLFQLVMRCNANSVFSW